MSERFEWVPDVARGEWLRPMEAERFGSILSVVPRGFEAYARVFHPVERDRPRDTATWVGVDEMTHFTGVDDIEASLQTERTTWAQAATSFGTTMHAEAQYARLIRDDGKSTAIAVDGWRYGTPSEGCFAAASLSTASAVLGRHTTTPDAGIAAIWDGWGGLASSSGAAYLAVEPGDWGAGRSPDEAPGRVAVAAFFERLSDALGRGIARSRAFLDAVPMSVRRSSSPGSGLLSEMIASGPRFALHGDTGRHYILFEAGANDFADATWPGRAPWVDEVMWAQSPSILWPDDHAWLLATEIDFDSTLVAGTSALIRELVQDPRLEALPIRPDADLSWDGDRLNRPDSQA